MGYYVPGGGGEGEWFGGFGLGVQFSKRLDFGVNFENAQNVRRAERF